ncbi:MAG: hypothetical protein RIR70_1484 [Pseudomonadota bacterium]|jgi:tetratricopeptide (TPR) repeat protein
MPIQPTSGRPATPPSQPISHAAAADIEALRQAVQASPQSAAAHEALGLALWAHGHTAPALDHFETALRHDPLRLEAILAIGEIFMIEGETDQVIEIMGEHLLAALRRLSANTQELIDFHRALPERLGNRFPPTEKNEVLEKIAGYMLEEGDQLLRNGQPHLAIDVLKSVSDINPHHLGSSHLLGDAYLATGQMALACHAFEQCATREPTAEQFIHNARIAGFKLLAAHAAGYALLLFRAAWSRAQEFNLPREQIAMLLVDLARSEIAAGSTLDALQSLNAAIRLHPMPAALIQRGLIYLGLGENLAAWEDFDKALPALTLLGNHSEVYQVAHMLMGLAPLSPKPIRWAAESAILLGRLDEAKTHFKALLQREMDKRGAQIGLLRIRLASGGLRSARAAFCKMADHDYAHHESNFWAAKSSLIEASQSPDEARARTLREEALMYARRALVATPESLSSKSLAADALLAVGKFEQALKGVKEIQDQLPAQTLKISASAPLMTTRALLEDRVNKHAEALHTTLNPAFPAQAPIWKDLVQRSVVSLTLARQHSADATDSDAASVDSA